MKYHKKPVVIEAMEFGPYTEALAPYPPLPEGGKLWQWLTDGGADFKLNADISEPGPAFLEIHTLEGIMRADIGDYIIKGIKGEFYPCKPDIFEATYEPV